MSWSKANESRRSTLQLLSRFAVFMWMAAEAREFWSAECDERQPCDTHEERGHWWACCSAIQRGLLRVTWGQP